jgi:hypothetical protein
MLQGSMSPAPTSKLASSLQPKAGPSRASQVFFRPPTPAPDSASNNNMDAANVKDPDPTINIPVAPTSTPPVPLARPATLEGADTDAFMADFDDPEAFYASGAKDKVLADLQAAMRSTHNLTETLNLWSHQGYHLNADAANSLVTELLQAVYTVSEIGLVQHALAAGSETQSIALRALIESLCAQAPPATAPSPPSRPSGSGPLPRSSNATSDPAGLRRPVKKALFVRSCKHPLPYDAKSFATVASAAVALPQPPPPKKRKGAATAQAGLVQMAKSFPSAPTATIVHAQQVVSGAAKADRESRNFKSITECNPQLTHQFASYCNSKWI